jgi:hypothetical protein
MANPDEIERRFTYQRPNHETAPMHERVNELTKGLAHALDVLLPEGREKACALTALQETRMWANAAIATDKSRAKDDS